MARLHADNALNRLRYLEASGHEAPTDGDPAMVVELAMAFAPLMRFATLDLSDERVRAGLGVTAAMFTRIGELCRRNDIECVVTFVSTKESVYFPMVRETAPAPQATLLSRLAEAEGDLEDRLVSCLHSMGFTVVDVLPALREKAKTEIFYPRNIDGHPFSASYRMIEETILPQQQAP